MCSWCVRMCTWCGSFPMFKFQGPGIQKALQSPSHPPLSLRCFLVPSISNSTFVEGIPSTHFRKVACFLPLKLTGSPELFSVSTWEDSPLLPGSQNAVSKCPDQGSLPLNFWQQEHRLTSDKPDTRNEEAPSPGHFPRPGTWLWVSAVATRLFVNVPSTVCDVSIKRRPCPNATRLF